MRFVSLGLENYGAMKACSLRIPPQPGLVVLYGRNEAGKSTCLSALCDFLYGIPDRTPHGQVFGYDAIRLTAELRLADGTALTLRRRKGRNRTLSDSAGNAMEEHVLARYLGGTGRDSFRTLFGIDHASLRSGGEQLLRADGDVGRLIVEAGGGLRTLVSTIERLGAEADRLFAARRSADRAFYASLDAFVQADRDVKDGLVTRDAWEAAQRRLQQAKEALARARAEHRAAAERGLQLDRLQRVIPSLRTLAAVESELQGFADVAALPDGFAEAVTKALDQRETARATARAAVDRCVLLEKQIAQQQPPAEVMAAEAALRDVGERAVHVRKQRADRPNRLRERAEAEAKLDAVRRLLALPADADLTAALPEEAALQRAQALAGRGVELIATAAQLGERLGSETAKRDALQRRVQERHIAGDDIPPGVSAADFAGATTLAAALDARRAELHRRQAEIARRVERLGFADAWALADLACPDADVVQAEIDRRTTLTTTLARLAERVAEATRQRDAAAVEMQRLAAGDGVPSTDALTEARAARDAAWAAVRTRYVSAGGAGVVDRGQEERIGDALDLDRRLAAADALADRREREAERIAALDRARRDHAEALLALQAFERERAAMARTAAADVDAFRAAWPEAAVRCADPGALKALVEERRQVLELREEGGRLETETEFAAANLAQQLAALAAAECLLGLEPAAADAPLAQRIAAVLAALKRREEAHADFRQELRALQGEEDRLITTRAAFSANAAASAEWRAAWAAVTARLGLAADVSPERATEIARQWASVPGLLDSLQLTLGRLRGMDDFERDLRRLVDDTAVQLGLAAPEDALAAADMLSERWKQAHERRVARDKLLPQLDALNAERDGAFRRVESAEDAVARLCTQAGCAGDDLAHVAVRARQRALLAERREGLLTTIATAGDGLAVDVLRGQCGGRDLDAITAERSQTGQDAGRLADAVEAALTTVNQATSALAAFTEAGTINAAVAAREAATAEMHQVLADHVERALARELLAEAMEQVRREQQDPLVQRASQLFEGVTRGAFRGIETDVDDGGEPIVVGVRASGAACHAAQMSDGTRDQLFLAFRIAGIERYCEAAEPLPFIADDLLVHFDDARSEATLALLAELGQRTQVLLFTHHRRVVEAAAALAQGGDAAIVDLPGD